MDNQQMPSGAYAGKNRVVKWVIIYLILGAVIYGGLYLAKFKSSYAPASPESAGQDTAPAEAPAGESVNVIISKFAFHPALITVAAGTPVIWTNDDAPPHTVTAVNGAFDSGNMMTGDTFTLPPLAPGTYQYYCKIHPNMRGTLIVK